MTPTIKEIAQLAGVSRGTVDRALHDRPGVAPEVRERIRRIAQELNYEPNTAALALKGASRNHSVGVIIPDLRNEFYHEVYEGIQAASRRYRAYGITIEEYHMSDINASELIKGIDTLLERGVDGLMLQGQDNPAVAQRIRSLPENFPIVTFNSDLRDSRRMCFVGQDCIAAGRVAGKMLAMMLRRKGKVAMFSGRRDLVAQQERLLGFQQVMEDLLPEVELLGPFETLEDENRAYQLALDLVKKEPELVGIYAAGGGQKNLAAGLYASNQWNEIKMVGHDLLPKTIEYLEQGVVNCTIAQEPYYQGYMPLEILSEYLLLGTKPAAPCLYTSIDIRIKDNANFDGFRTFRQDSDIRNQ